MISTSQSAEEIAECALDDGDDSSSLPGSPSLQREHRMRWGDHDDDNKVVDP